MPCSPSVQRIVSSLVIPGLISHRITMPAAPSGPITTNIPQRMDRLPWSRWHWLVVTALGVTWLLDGLKVSIVAALGPILTHTTTLHLTESEVGLTASAYLAGSVFGAIVFSYLTDRQGRKSPSTAKTTTCSMG